MRRAGRLRAIFFKAGRKLDVGARAAFKICRLSTSMQLLDFDNEPTASGGQNRREEHVRIHNADIIIHADTYTILHLRASGARRPPTRPSSKSMIRPENLSQQPLEQALGVCSRLWKNSPCLHSVFNQLMPRRESCGPRCSLGITFVFVQVDEVDEAIVYNLCHAIALIIVC